MINVQIWKEFNTGQIKMVFIERNGLKATLVNFYTGICKEISEGEIYPDEFILKIPHTMARDVFKGMAEAMDGEGVKTENDFKIQGTLEATRFHLEDLRTILKLKK